MFLLCHGWALVVHELLASPAALASFALQQAIVWVAFVLIDERLSRRWAQFSWAAVGTLYATVTLLDGLLMRMTSLPMREMLPMLLASQNVIEGLREIGLKPIRVVILFVALLTAAAAGGGVRLLLQTIIQRSRFAKRAMVRLPRASFGVLVVLLVVFGGEQALARDQPDYLYRGFHMPEYVQLYSRSSRSVEISLPPPVSHEQRSKWLAAISPAKNPKHVLYVLLESFRADAVEPRVSPTMTQLGRESLQFEHAFAEATYTPLSWSVLLFDEFAHDNIFGRHPGRREPIGSWLVAVMKKAGYTPHVYVSTNLTYAKTRERLLGADPKALDFFQAASDQGDNPNDKNKNDRLVADHALDFIAKHDWKRTDPQFMLLQLDSTHYTYPFPADHAPFAPYSEDLALPRPIQTHEEAVLLANRYRNAANYVDSQLARVIAGLKQAGIYEDTAIVLTADHGEGLEPGFQGHAAVFEATRHVPLILKLPGRAPKLQSQLISHRDILPTLADYLQIDMPSDSTRGRSALQARSNVVLTLAPTGRFGQLVTNDRVVDLRLLFGPTSVTVTPAASNTQAEAEWLPLMQAFVQAPNVQAPEYRSKLSLR